MLVDYALIQDFLLRNELRKNAITFCKDKKHCDIKGSLAELEQKVVQCTNLLDFSVKTG